MKTNYSNALLFLVTSFIWGTTWLGVQFQLGVVPETWSVVYRFALAAFLLFLYCLVTQKPMQFSWREHVQMALQGLLLFCVNYLLFYYGSEHLISGLLALFFSSIVIFNLFNSWLFLRSRIGIKTLLGSALGMLGIAMVIYNEVQHLPHQGRLGDGNTSLSLLLTGIGIYIGSLGNIVATCNQRKGLPIIQTNCYGMAYGALFALLINLLLKQPARFDMSWPYIGSLLYLSVLGSIVAFGTYIMLLKRIGSERAVYTFVLVPFISMILSTFFEGFVWHPIIFVGLLLAVGGNVLVLGKKK